MQASWPRRRRPRSEPPEVAPFIPGWNSYVSVENADDTAAKVTDAGGMVVTEPFDLLDVARVAVFADPAIVVFCVWQPRERKGAQLVNEPGAWSFSVLNTRDPEDARSFYGAVFGCDSEMAGPGEDEIAL